MELLKTLWASPAIRRAAVTLATLVAGGIAAYFGDMTGGMAVAVTALAGFVNAWLSNYIPKDA